MKRSEIPRGGVISTRNWMTMPDGDQYKAFWCKKWLVVTNKEAGLADIKSSDKWAAVAYSDDDCIMLIIPGCEITSFAIGLKTPISNAIYNVHSCEY